MRESAGTLPAEGGAAVHGAGVEEGDQGGGQQGGGQVGHLLAPIFFCLLFLPRFMQPNIF